MRVIDIMLNEEVKGYTVAVENAHAWIDRLNQFMDPNNPQRPFVLRTDANVVYELTADKYDANQRNEQGIILEAYNLINAAIQTGDHLQMSAATTKLSRKLKEYSNREVTRIRKESGVRITKKADRISLPDQIANVIDFINSPNNRRLDNRYTYERSFMSLADKLTLEKWIKDAYKTDKLKLQALVNWLKDKETRTEAPKELENTHGELPEDFDPQNPLHVYWKNLVDSTRWRGDNVENSKTQYTMSYKELWQIITEQDWKCYLTNIPMLGITSHENSISIDRKDSTVGYISGNVAFCCYRANIIKGTLSVNELVAMCKQILIHKKIISKGSK